MSEILILQDDRGEVHIGKAKYTKGSIVAPEHVKPLRHAGYTIEAFQLPAAAEDKAAAPQAATKLPYKELKARALELGYDGADGMGEPALLAYVESKEKA